MATNEISTVTSKSQATSERTDFVSRIKWFFQKTNDWSWSKKSTRAFWITRKESLITTFAAILVIIWWWVYWWIVYEKYTEINDNLEPLRELSTYNVTPGEILSQYSTSKDKISTFDDMIKVNNNVEEAILNLENSKKEEMVSYETLLQKIYLPSLNVWKDPYTKNFDTTILWQKYLETDKFQDLYLIQYWSDFIKNVWNDADYNTVESISIWDKVEVEDSDYFYIPITVSFESPNKRSFLLLVNKLSMTSNSNNVALLNEFFFYLLKNIKNNKTDEINKLMQEYWKDFSSSSDWHWTTDYSKLEWAEREDYIYKVIWYNLYHRINNDWIGWNSPLIDDEIIENTIRENASCNLNMWKDNDKECFYNFREKYRSLPYLAYKIWLWEQSNRTAWLLSFLQDLPPAIAITSFTFNKYSSSSFLNNNTEQYHWSVTFNAYWRNVTQAELDETSSMLWKLCFWNNPENKITPDVALDNVNTKIASLWWTEDQGNRNDMSVLSLWELQWLFEDIQNKYGWLSRYNKMIKMFELWRMMNDANLCSHG